MKTIRILFAISIICSGITLVGFFMMALIDGPVDFPVWYRITGAIACFGALIFGVPCTLMKSWWRSYDKSENLRIVVAKKDRQLSDMIHAIGKHEATKLWKQCKEKS